jgi:serine/threonine protein kinase
MIEQIGRGGMGQVWRADDLVLQTPVALKLINAPSPEGRERILNEVRLARLIAPGGVPRIRRSARRRRGLPVDGARPG